MKVGTPAPRQDGYRIMSSADSRQTRCSVATLTLGKLSFDIFVGSADRRRRIGSQFPSLEEQGLARLCSSSFGGCAQASRALFPQPGLRIQRLSRFMGAF